MKAMLATDQVNRVLVETSNGVVEMRPVLVFGHVVSKPPVPVAQDALNVVMIGDETSLAALIAATMQVLSKGETLIGELAGVLYDQVGNADDKEAR